MKPVRSKLLLTTHIESFINCKDEMLDLNFQHYTEISEHRKHSVPLNPDYDKYYLKENNGELLYITLRHQGKLVGYYIGFIGSGLHYRDCFTSVMDIIFVGKEVRGQKGDALLIEALKTEIKRRANGRPTLILVGYKENHKQFLPKTYAEAGFKPFDHIMALWL